MNVALLERASGNAGIDVGLIGEITDASNRILREIGLDPADSTGVETYKALHALVRTDEPRARQLLGERSYILAATSTGPISLNFFDVVENDHHELPYEKRGVSHAQRRLRAELVRRYAEHERTHADVVHNLAREVGLLVDEDAHYVDTDAMINAKQETDMQKPYILAIGDIFTDAFITLGDETAKIIKEGDTEWLAVPFGRKPPYEKVDIVKSVGPSPNVAVSIARLGYRAGLMAWVGGDATGDEALEHLRHENVNTEPMVIEEDKATS